MFVSASFDLKLHSFGEDGVETYNVQPPPAHTNITAVSFCNDNSYLAVLRDNDKPQIFSVKDKLNARQIHTINVTGVTALAFKRTTKRHIAMGTKNGDVLLYDTKARSVSSIFSGISDTVKTLEFTCDDQQLCVLDGDVLVVIPDLNQNTCVCKYKQGSECTVLKCHPYIAKRVAIGCKNGHVILWDVHQNAELCNLDLLTTAISDIALSSCGSFLVASGRDIKVCGVNCKTGARLFQVQLGQDHPVSCLGLDATDSFLAAGLSDGSIRLFDVKNQMKQLYGAKLHDGAVAKLMFENKAKEPAPTPNSSFSSLKQFSEHQMREDACRVVTARRSVKSENRDECLDRLKSSLLRTVKMEMDLLENQLNEHCVKFQRFLDNEFETIDIIIKKKWDVFHIGDMNQIMKAIFPEDNKSVYE